MRKTPSEATERTKSIPRTSDEIDNPISWEPSLSFLKYTIAALLVGALVVFLTVRILAPDQTLRTFGSVLVSIVAATGWYFLSRGRVTAAINVLAYGIWTVATGLAVYTGGVRAPVAYVYPVIILMIGWMISSRAALAATGLTLAAIFCFVAAELWGLLPAPLPTSPILHGSIQVIISILAAALVGRLVQAYQNRLKEIARRTQELEGGEAELSRAQAVGNVGSWVYDIPNDSMRLSAETCRIFGLPEGMTGSHDSYLARTFAQDRNALNCAWQEALKGAGFDYEHRIVVGEEIRWVRQKAELEFAADGTPMRAVGVTQDISDRKKVEEVLRDSDESLHSILDTTLDGYWRVDNQGNLLEVNPAYCKQSGYTRSELLEMNISELEAVEKPGETAEHIRSLIQRGHLQFETIHRRKDGSLWPVEVSATFRNAAGGQLFSFLRDISERKRSETDLRIAAAAFDSNEPLLVTDANQVILRVNRAFTEDTGYTSKEAVGQTPRLLKSGRHDADFYGAMWETINRTGKWQGEIWDRRKNGVVYPKWLSISAVSDNAGVVTHYVGAHMDISEHKKAEEKIKELAFFDQLTGLPNRTLLMDRLRQNMTASSRNGSYSALLFIDLDNFKTLNDTHGHDMGDMLLKQAAQRLTGSVRAGDSVARLGGDEFVVMLANLSTSQKDAATQTEAVGRKILTALSQTYILRDAKHQCTASIGATMFTGNQTAIDDLLKQADLAMYQSKEAGRNGLRFFERDMEGSVINRTTLEDELHQAISQKQFLLHYQAQMMGDQLTEVEALVRWQHPQRGLLSPAEFLPLAEKTGLILLLGQWVLEAACAQLSLWAQRPELAHLKLAVNISTHQFRQPDFVDQVLTVIKKTGANPQRLKLELTESLLVSSVEEVIEKMLALKAAGVSFSLDDFCTSYSSLSYLRRLPLDQLKIDQSFVRDVLSNSNDASIAKTIIALAQGLGLGVIAEGVETAMQQDFLANAGCHAYQGYLFSKPLPLEGFERFARQVH